MAVKQSCGVQFIRPLELKFYLDMLIPCMSRSVIEQQLQPQEGLSSHECLVKAHVCGSKIFDQVLPASGCWVPSCHQLVHCTTLSASIMVVRKAKKRLRQSESCTCIQPDFTDVSQENTDVAEQLDPCITRKPFAPLQGNTHPVLQLEKDAVRSQTETGTNVIITPKNHQCVA